MPTIKLAEPWTYRTPLVTVRYPKGEHDVAPEIAEAAPAQPEEEQEADNGSGDSAPRPTRRARKAKG